MQIPYHLRNTHPLSKLDEALLMRERYTSAMLYSGRGMFMDELIDGYTALMVEPYPDRPDTHGEPVFTPEAFNEAAILADSLGLQISVHCCGDGAVRRTSTATRPRSTPTAAATAASRSSTSRPSPTPIFPAPAGRGGVDAAAARAAGELFHHAAGGDLQRPAGAQRLPVADPARAGATLAFNTDWPIVPVDPMMTFAAAMFPTRPDDRWQDSGRACTTPSQPTPATAPIPSLQKRRRADQGRHAGDLVCLSENLEAADEAILRATRAVVTVCDGRVTGGRL